MRARVFGISAALLGLVTIVGCAGPALRSRHILVKETFEGSVADIAPAFWLCWRPENDFTISTEQARTGRSSLKQTVRKVGLFAHLDLPITKAVEANTCMATLTIEEGKQYLNDEAERAELRENKTQSPRFGDDVYYGFSMFIARDSAPLDDFNRMVVGQWKIQRRNPLPPNSPPLDSPFLALRMTGGFFHIMLSVESALKDGAQFAPSDCKVLLAFTGETPPNSDKPLPLSYPAQCESRLNYDLNQGQSAPPSTLNIERFGYLPDPSGNDGKGTWVDLIFHIKSGKNGVVEIWANGTLAAKATGWIGYWSVDQVGDLQYFKFGPYRDPAGYDSVIYLDNLARGSSKNEVDPSK